MAFGINMLIKGLCSKQCVHHDRGAYSYEASVTEDCECYSGREFHSYRT